MDEEAVSVINAELKYLPFESENLGPTVVTHELTLKATLPNGSYSTTYKLVGTLKDSGDGDSYYSIAWQFKEEVEEGEVGYVKDSAISSMFRLQLAIAEVMDKFGGAICLG